MRLPELLILRHGETEWNREGRMQGRLDSPLTMKGREQAAAQGRILSGIAQGFDWYVSPRGRVIETARIASGGAVLREDARLAEIDMGDWTGRLRDEIAAEAPHLFRDDGSDIAYYHAIPGGDTLQAVQERLAEFAACLSRPSVIVTHGIASRVLRCIALGLPWEAFEELDGGQGVVYRIAPGIYDKLTEQGAIPQPRPLAPQAALR
ncbi:MAG: histidine phosphatase family protein [Maritimibacter sp.]|nr:histidine phosphatase family protein [Maritimibacter sp.]